MLITTLAVALCFAGSALASPRSVAWHVSQVVFGAHASTAFCIAGAETGGTYSETAISKTNDYGEWQIHNGLTMYGPRIFNAYSNALVAFRMSRGGTDWSPWTTHARCGV